MRRFMVLVTVVLLMVTMLVASVAPAFARGGNVRFWSPTDGTAVDPVVCTVLADDSPIIGWRNGTCWVFHPGPVAAF